MKLLLDTDTCVFWLRGRESVRERLAAAGIDSIAVSISRWRNCATELIARPDRLITTRPSTISPVLGVDFETARLFGEIKAHLRKQGMLAVVSVPSQCCLTDGQRLAQIPRRVRIDAARHAQVAREKLRRQRQNHGRQEPRARGDRKVTGRHNRVLGATRRPIAGHTGY